MAEGEHTHPEAETPAVVVNEAADVPGDLIAPVVDHASKIAEHEARFNTITSDFYNRIDETERRLQDAIANKDSGRIDALEARLNDLLSLAEEAPEEAVTPESESVPEVHVETPEKKTRKVRRNGRLVTRNG